METFTLLPPEHAHYFPEAELVAVPTLQDASGARLRGRGFSIPAASAGVLALIDDSTEELRLKTVGAGAQPKLAAGPAEVVVPIEVQTEAQPWLLELSPVAKSELPLGVAGVDALAKTAGGDLIGGLGTCTFTLAGMNVETEVNCRYTYPKEQPPSGALCVKARTRNTCRDLQ